MGTYDISIELFCTLITILSLIIVIWATPIVVMLWYKIPQHTKEYKLVFIRWLVTKYLRFAIMATIVIVVIGFTIILIISK